MKIVRGVKYLHKSNIKELNIEDMELPVRCEDLLKEKNLDAFNSYVVIKIDGKNSSVSFIESDDFDTAHEPTVGDAHKITLDGGYKVTKKKKNPQIYHHKWSFVSNDYNGFDIEQSKRRSQEWETKLASVNKSKIGYKSYWEECLASVGMKYI